MYIEYITISKDAALILRVTFFKNRYLYK